jgi:hypothetical protein
MYIHELIEFYETGKFGGSNNGESSLYLSNELQGATSQKTMNLNWNHGAFPIHSNLDSRT